MQHNIMKWLLAMVLDGTYHKTLRGGRLVTFHKIKKLNLINTRHSAESSRVKKDTKFLLKFSNLKNTYERGLHYLRSTKLKNTS